MTSFQTLELILVMMTLLPTFRACVGRNFAFLELQIIIASVMRRYDICLAKEGQKVIIRLYSPLISLLSFFLF